MTGLEEDVLFAPMRAADEVMTQGAEDLAAADLWLDHVNQLREDLERLPWWVGETAGWVGGAAGDGGYRRRVLVISNAECKVKSRGA